MLLGGCHARRDEAAPHLLTGRQPTTSLSQSNGSRKMPLVSLPLIQLREPIEYRSAGSAMFPLPSTDRSLAPLSSRSNHAKKSLPVSPPHQLDQGPISNYDNAAGNLPSAEALELEGAEPSRSRGIAMKPIRSIVEQIA